MALVPESGEISFLQSSISGLASILSLLMPQRDPVEAEAINKAFFSTGTSPNNLTVNDRLFVGSIKTIIGHLEGAAGIAGLLKVARALKNKVVPPNMHFDNLNPKVAPFTEHLRIPTVAETWPHVPGATVRRASVASFGFGGSNAFVLLK